MNVNRIKIIVILLKLEEKKYVTNPIKERRKINIQRLEEFHGRCTDLQNLRIQKPKVKKPRKMIAKFVKESSRYQGPVEHERARKKNKAGESIRVNNKNIFVNPTRHCCFGYYHAANLSQDYHYHSHKRHQIPHFC